MNQPSNIPAEDLAEHVNTFRRAIDLLGGRLDGTPATGPDGPEGADEDGSSPWSDTPVEDHSTRNLPGVALTPAPSTTGGWLAGSGGLPAASVAPAGEAAVDGLAVEGWMPTLAYLVGRPVAPVAAVSTPVHPVRRPRTGGHLPRNVVVQPRDLALLRTIVELRLVTIPLLRSWFFAEASSATVVNNWLGRMTATKLMKKQPGLTPNGHALYRPTGTAYHLLGITGRPRDIQLIEHTLYVAETYLMLQAKGWQVTSERAVEIQIAANAKRNGAIVAGRFWTPVGTAVHPPDLVIEKDGAWWHVEVETTAKDQRRYNALMLGAAVSARQGLSAGVLYVVPGRGRVNPTTLRTKLERAATAGRDRLETTTGLAGFPTRRPIPRLHQEWWLVRPVTFTWDRPVARREPDAA